MFSMNNPVRSAAMFTTRLACAVLLLAGLAGCSLSGSISQLGAKITGPNRPKVALSLDTATLSLAEGGTALISFAISQPLDIDATIRVTLAKSGGSTMSRFQPFSSTIKIPAGHQIGSLTLVTINDAIYQGTENFTLNFASDEIETSGANLLLTLLDDETQPTVTFTTAAQTVNKSAAGTALVTAQLSGRAAMNVMIPFTTSGTAVLGTDATISASPLVIPAQTLSASASVTVLNDTVVEPDKTLTLTMGTTVFATVGATPVSTVTIFNDLIGTFAIDGVSGPGNLTPSAFLSGGANPTMTWHAASGASSYDVTVYNSDGVTVACPTVNTTLLTQAFAGCTLTIGSSYKAAVVAKAGSGSRPASNSLFAFKVNADPVPGTHGPYYAMAGGSLVLAASTLVAADSDPDTGDGALLTIASVVNGTSGTAALSSGNITYTPGAGFTGNDSFTYVLSDTHGGVATATVTISVVTPFTWTGNAANSNYQTAGNWCGTINPSATGCLGTGAVPGASDKAIFDGTCQASCSANLSADTSVGGIKLGSGYSGTLTQGANNLTIGSLGFDQAAGTFTGSSNVTKSVTINGPYTLSAGTFTAPAGTLTVGDSSWSITGSPTFSANSGKIIFTKGYGSPAVITPGSVTYNDVQLSTWLGDFDFAAGTMRVDGNFICDDHDGRNTAHLENGTILLHGDLIAIANDGQGCDGGALIRLTGNASGQTITGGASTSFPGVEIAAGTSSVTLNGIIKVQGDYKVTSVGTLTTAGSDLTIVAPYRNISVLPGTTSYNNVNLLAALSTIDLGGQTFNVGGNLSLQELDYRRRSYLNSGTVLASKNVSVSGNMGWQGDALLKLAGNVAGQTLTSTASAAIPNLEIATGLHNVTFAGDLVIGGNYSLTSVGALTVAATPLVFRPADFSGATIQPGTVAYSDVTFTGQLTTFDLAGTTMNVGGTLSLEAMDGRNSTHINNGTILLAGDLKANVGLGANGSALVKLTGNGSGQTITGASGSDTPNLEIAAGINNVTLSGTLSLNGNYTVTSYGTLSAAGANLQFDGWGPFFINPGSGVTYGSIAITQPSNYSLLSDLTGSSLSLSGASQITKNAHVLTIGGSAVGSGSLYGGTVNP